MVRTALYQAAHVLLHHGRWSRLRGWAMRIAKRVGAENDLHVGPARPDLRNDASNLFPGAVGSVFVGGPELGGEQMPAAKM